MRTSLFIICLTCLSLSAYGQIFNVSPASGPAHPPMVISPTSGNDSIPPYDFYGDFARLVGNTFNNTYALTQDTTVHLSFSSDLPCNIYLFNRDNPEAFSVSFTNDSISNGKKVLDKTVSIPQSGNYLLLVNSPNNIGKCSLTVNSKTYNDVDVSDNSYWVTLDTINTYNTFTNQSTHSFKLCAIEGANPGTVVAYNDNYVGSGDHNWGSDARIKRKFNNPNAGFIVFANYDYAKFAQLYIRFTDVYIGCKTPTFPYSSYFKNLKEDDIIQTAPASSIYNCISWAGGEWDTWNWPPMVFSQYYDPDPLTAFDNYFEEHGFTRTGATEFDSKIDLWVNNGNFTHASIKNFANNYACGYAWESKAGMRPRFMHPRYAINGNGWNDYGTVGYHYVAINGFQPEQCIIENFQFTDDESQYISSRIAAIPPIQRTVFQVNYNALKKEFANAQYDNFELLESSQYYINLLNLCLSKQDMLCLLYKSLESGDILPSMIIKGATMASNMDIMNYVWAYNANNSYNESGIRLKRSITANTILYAKYMIAKAQNMQMVQGKPAGTTYSDDSTILNASISDGTAHISVSADEGAEVIVTIAQDNGRAIRQLYGGKAGGEALELEASIQSKGTYIITAHVNGRIYSKKLYIK